MSTDKPSRNEEEYFAKLDAELIAQQRAREAAEREAAERRSHYMKCPKDGYDLTTTEQRGVSVDVCSHCGGLWLDHGELEALLTRPEESHGLLQRVFDDMRSILGRGRKDRA
jgi:hypothetical protein